MIATITLVYDVPEGEFAEAHSLGVLKEVYDYVNKHLKSVSVEIERP